MRVRLVDHLYRFEMVHESRQILEIAPERVELFGRGIDRHALFNTNAAAIRNADLIALSISSGEAEGFVDEAVPGSAAPDERAADAGKHEPGDRSPFES